MIPVLRAERHQINKNHFLWTYCDDICFKSKNLYNASNYVARQIFIITSKLAENKPITPEQQDYLNHINSKVDQYNFKKSSIFLNKRSKGKGLDKTYKAFPYFDANHKYLGYNFLEFIMNESVDYKAIMAQVAQQTLRLLDKDWISFFESIKKYRKDKSGFTGRPKLPNYKKKKGRTITTFTNQNCKHVDDHIQFPKCFDQFSLKTNVNHLNQVRIKPQGGNYVLEIIDEIEVPEGHFKSEKIISLDLGIDNFATVSNNIGEQPIIINGKTIKSINQYYNKKKADLVRDLKKRHRQDWSNRLQQLTNQRNNKVDDFLHKSSKKIIDECLLYGIDTIVVGKNDGWKQESKMSKQVNQNFVQIPHALFIKKLTYKAENVGIKVIETEESYTSGTSFLDGELPIQENYDKSRRKYRGLFISNDGIKINADLNGSYQIMKKVFPKAFVDGIEGVGLHPVRVNIA